MIGEFRASLYDLFGYLLPGLVMTSALGILWWTIFGDSTAFPIDFVATGVGGTGFLILAYVIGHVAHAVGNSLPILRASLEDEILSVGHEWSLPSPVLIAIDRSLRRRFSLDPTDLDAVLKYSLMDEGRALMEREGDREVYVYREGFYRGMVVALLFGGIAALARVFVSPTCFSYGLTTPCGTRVQAGVLFLLVGACIVAYYRRMRRFGRYRIERAVFLWLNEVSQKERRE